MADEPSTTEQNASDASTELKDTNGDIPHVDATFQVTIRLPHEPYKIQTVVATQDQAQDVRQSIIDTPHTFQYSCFHLERDGVRIPDFVDLGEIESITPDAELTLVEDPYTEKDARLHLLRIRDLLGAAGDRTDLSHGVQAGLTLHDEIAQAAAGESNEDHPMSTFDFAAPASLNALLPSEPSTPPKVIKSISLSAWNPPPYNLRNKGHLLYIQATTNEGDQFQITSHTTGFFVNKSTNSKFDPFPKTAPKPVRAHSLLTLLSRLSLSFDSTFKALQEYNGKRDPLSTFQPTNAIPASPWLVSGTSLTTLHVSDLARSQESFLISGVDNAETLRDWNEEFQTLKELPKDTVQDRVFRERTMSKLFADYTEAATTGAMLIARGEVAPLNPTENRDAQIFVYNNVFYSFGADGVGTFTNEGGDEAARVATGKDVSGVRIVNQLDITGLSSPGTVVVDVLGKRLVGQSIVPGIFRQREPGDQQIDYGGVEGKDVVAENEAFKPVFEKLAKAMKTKQHPVWDKEGKRHELETSVETKGLLGTDGRKYALDLYRLTPLDISWIEKHWKGVNANSEGGYVHRMTVLRPELVEAWWRTKLSEFVTRELARRKSNQSDPSPNGEETKDERVDVSDFAYALNPDAFSGQQPQSEQEKEQWDRDEVEVRAACQHLQDEVIPRLISDLKDGEVGFPMDGASLSSLCHKRGINLRYFGKLADSCTEEPRLQALRVLVIREMIARAFKHVCNQALRYLPTVFATACASHLLNCLLGSELTTKPDAMIDGELRAMYPEVDFGFEHFTPQKLHEEIARQVMLRFRHDLPATWVAQIQHIQLLREIALKLGLQLAAREYQFQTPTSNGLNGNGHADAEPQTNGKKKKKSASPSRSTATPPPILGQTFQPDDIVNIVPVVKESSPRSSLAEEALDAGRFSVAQNQRDIGQELLLESLSLHEQIYGVLHAEVARVYHTLSTLFYSLDDKNIAVELARKAVIVSERTMGVDASETILSYLNLGLFEHAVGNSRLALALFRHALSVSKIVYGVDHPDSITTLNNAAVMLQNLKLFRDSRTWFEAALAVCQRFSGPNSIHTATLLFQLAQAFALDHDPKAAVNRMREAYNIFNAVLGPEDRNTKESETWLEQLTQNAVSIAKHAKDVQARRMRRIQQLTPGSGSRVTMQRLVGQASAAQVSSREPLRPLSQQAAGLDERSIDELIKYIEGGDAAKASPRKKTANPKQRQRPVVY